MRRKLKIIPLLLAAAMLTSSLPCYAAPILPESENSTSVILPTGTGMDAGFSQERYNFDTGQKAASSHLRKSSYLPAQYSLPKQGLDTAVKDQGNSSACWAYTTLAGLESSVIRQTDKKLAPNFSARHLAWFGTHLNENGSGYGLPETSATDALLGGNLSKGLSLLASWQGACPDTEYPVNTGSNFISESGRYDSELHLQNADIFPAPLQASGTLDADALNTIKEAITQTSAVGVELHADPNADFRKTSLYSTQKAINHTVSIVGWDDSYSKNNFSTPAPGDGAWLVHNSWGASWGKDGYGYVSYYDDSLQDYTAYSADATDKQGRYRYDNIYQYDALGLGDTADYKSYDRPVSAANIFTADSDQTLKAVSVTSAKPGSVVDIAVYLLYDVAVSPDSGKLVFSQKSTISYGGFHTVDLQTPVQLSAGQRFAVVESIREPSGMYYIPVEVVNLYQNGQQRQIDTQGCLYREHLPTGCSFVQFGSDDWMDLAKAQPDVYPFTGSQPGAATIKAYTVSAVRTSSDLNADTLYTTQVKQVTVTSDTAPTVHVSDSTAAAVTQVKAWDEQTKKSVWSISQVNGAKLQAHSGTLGIYATVHGTSTLLGDAKMQAAPYESDTTATLHKKAGQSYVTKIYAPRGAKVNFYPGSAGYVSTKLLSKVSLGGGAFYYFQTTALRPGCTGLYLSINEDSFSLYKESIQ